MAYVSFKVTETYSHGLEGFTGGSGQSLAVTQNSVLSPAAAEQHQLLLPDLGLRIFFFFRRGVLWDNALYPDTYILNKR